MRIAETLLACFLFLGVASAEDAQVNCDQNGKVFQVMVGDDIDRYSKSPTTSFRFDVDTNSALIDDMQAQFGSGVYSCGVSEILKNGQPVVINGDGSLKMSLSAAKAIWSSIKNDTEWNSLTAAQKAEAIRRVEIYIVRILIKKGIIRAEDFQ